MYPTANGKDLAVAVVMGSDSDLPTMNDAIEILKSFDIETEVQILSAHRTPLEMIDFAKNAHLKGIKTIIAGAGGAAHLPGMIASLTPLPVIGVPIFSKSLLGIDSALSILQMPGGVPVATVAIGGGLNAGLLSAEIIGLCDQTIQKKVQKYKSDLHKKILDKNHSLKEIGSKNYLKKMQSKKSN